MGNHDVEGLKTCNRVNNDIEMVSLGNRGSSCGFIGGLSNENMLVDGMSMYMNNIPDREMYFSGNDAELSNGHNKTEWLSSCTSDVWLADTGVTSAILIICRDDTIYYVEIHEGYGESETADLEAATNSFCDGTSIAEDTDNESMSGQQHYLPTKMRHTITSPHQQQSCTSKCKMFFIYDSFSFWWWGWYPISLPKKNLLQSQMPLLFKTQTCCKTSTITSTAI